MRYQFTLALPFLIGALAAVVQALMEYLGTIHPATPTAVMIVMIATALGDWLRAQIRVWQAKQNPPPNP